jgi:hypothetical protein
MALELQADEVGSGPNGCSHRRLDAVADAIEGVFISTQVRNALSNAIDAATTPLILTTAQKRRAVLLWAQRRIAEMD